MERSRSCKLAVRKRAKPKISPTPPPCRATGWVCAQAPVYVGTRARVIVGACARFNMRADCARHQIGHCAIRSDLMARSALAVAAASAAC
jgi:hypothetical protein